MRQEMINKGMKTAEEEAQEKFEWGVGTKQKAEMRERMEVCCLHIGLRYSYHHKCIDSVCFQNYMYVGLG